MTLLADGLLVLVEEADEVLDPALIAELGPCAGAALVDEHDAQAAREEGGLAQALLERVHREVDGLEDLRVRVKGDRRAGRGRPSAVPRPSPADPAARRARTPGSR